MSQFHSNMCTEMPNLKSNYLTSLSKEVNPQRPVARPKVITIKLLHPAESKNMSKSEPNEEIWPHILDLLWPADSLTEIWVRGRETSLTSLSGV